MNIYQSNTYKKDLSWLHIDNEPKVPERQQVKGQQSCIFVFILVATRSTSPDMTTVFHARPYGRFIVIYRATSGKKLDRTNQGSNFLAGSFSNRHNNVRALIQFRRKVKPSILKDAISDAEMLYPCHGQGRTSLNISLMNIKGAIYFSAFNKKATVLQWTLSNSNSQGEFEFARIMESSD